MHITCSCLPTSPCGRFMREILSSYGDSYWTWPYGQPEQTLKILMLFVIIWAFEDDWMILLSCLCCAHFAKTVTFQNNEQTNKHWIKYISNLIYSNNHLKNIRSAGVGVFPFFYWHHISWKNTCAQEALRPHLQRECIP